LQADRIFEVSSRGRGCSIAVAAGSVMSEVVQGLSLAEVHKLHNRLAKLVRGEPGVEALPELDERILAFSRIAEVPARERCALLPWEALMEALERCS